ncbi:glycine/betaine ABC transporter ATP-binding protein, partial [Chryseobacterium sp. CH1]
LLLEYKVTALHHISPFLTSENSYSTPDGKDNTSVWDILQQLSSDHQNAEVYEEVVRAFNHYRKSQMV